MADLNKMLEEIKKLSVVEVSELVKMLEEEFGVSAAAPAAVAAAPGAEGGAGAEEEEEKSEFDVVLKEIKDGKKIAVIKVVREITGLGLSDAKALVDKTPETVKEAVPTDTAKEYKEKIEAAGAVVELK